MPVSIAASASSTSKGSVVQLARWVSDGSTAGTTFTNIPNTYRDLMIVANGRTTRAVADDHMLIALNTNTSLNYSYTYMRTDGTSLVSARGIDGAFVTAFGCYSGSLAPTGVMGSGTLHLFNYANSSAYKGVLTKGSADLGSSGYMTLSHNLFKGNTDSINNLYCITYNNLVAGSSITLYGIKGLNQ